MDLRVLVIESEPEELLFLHDVFREIEEGRWLAEWPRIETFSAATWQEAERVLSTCLPHAIVLDLEQGVETFRLVQAAVPDVPVILLLNSGEGALAVKLIREGAQDFLLKGQVDCAPLSHALRNAVLRQRLLTASRAAARTDSLTGLCNQAGFLALASRDRKLAERLQRRWMLLIAEPKHLAEITDAFGEQRRDLELVEAAEHLRCLVTPADALARFGERHFAISVFDSETESVEQAWARLRKAAAERRIEIGVSIFHEANPLSVDAMIEQARADLPRRMPSEPTRSNFAGAA